MRSKDPKLMEDIRIFIRNYYEENLNAPTLEIIAENVTASRATVQRYLVAMKEAGALDYKRGIQNPSKMITNFSPEYSAHPITGDIHCGDPRSQEADIEEYVVLPDSIFGKGEKYLLRCKGDSMEDAGISEGDLVVIKVTPTAEKGDIVVALDAEGQNTLKRYEGYNRTRKVHILGYMNQAVYPDRKIEVNELVVQGVAGHVIKQLRNND